MSNRKFIDIGANLTDCVFKGIYHGKSKHRDDFADVLERAWNIGMQKIIVTSGCIEDCKQSLQLIEQNEKLYTTIGVHPTRAENFTQSPNEHIQELKSLIASNKDKVVAVGEIGLDYDRLHFCDKETQKIYFEKQFELVDGTDLPLFLHSRNCRQDFYAIMKQNRHRFNNGVVHSFTGCVEEVKELLDLDLFIGINGCSLKTQENIDTMCAIPSEKLMIETDAPWCEIKQSHAGFKHVNQIFPVKKVPQKFVDGCIVKGRNEPSLITHVLDVIAKARGEDADVLADIIFKNTNRIFFENQ